MGVSLIDFLDFFLRAGPWSENRKCEKMRFSFLCFYYRDKLRQQLDVGACSTRLRAANYTASICGLPLAESNFHTAISTIISYIQTHTHTPSTHTATQRNKEAHTEKKKKLQIVSCLRPPHHYTTVHHTGEVWMVVVFKTHENRQIVVHTRGIQRRGVFYHELRIKGLNCVESRGSFSQVRTPVRKPIVRLSSKWRRLRTKATIAICTAKHKGVRRRQVVLKDHYSPSAAVMTTNYGTGRG